MTREKQVRRAILGFWLTVIGLISLGLIAMCSFAFYDFVSITKYGKPHQLTYSQEIFLASNLDKPILARNNLPIFDAKVDKIYCIIPLQGAMGLRFEAGIAIQWYYNNMQITGHYISNDSWGKIIVWLEPPKNQPFRSGQYSVKIVIDQYFVETVNFEIK